MKCPILGKKIGGLQRRGRPLPLSAAGHLQIRDLANSQLHAGIVLQRSTAVPVYVDVLCLQLYTAVVVATAAVAAAG